MWATIYSKIHEVGKLMPWHEKHLPFMLRFIDDIIGIWVGDRMEWKDFKNDVSNFGILTWTFEEPSTSVNFLDLTISIEENNFVTKTDQR